MAWGPDGQLSGCVVPQGLSSATFSDLTLVTWASVGVFTHRNWHT